MPKKIREIINELERSGFVNRGGKGSHRNFRHSAGLDITINGILGDDAKHYQIKDVKQAIKLVKNEKA